MRDRRSLSLLQREWPGINGRGSHGHNDVLSIEVSAVARVHRRSGHIRLFRGSREATRVSFDAYHSTVQIDGLEQNTIALQTPFVIGNEAKPRVLEWKTSDDFDKVVANIMDILSFIVARYVR
jgi:hypothetical protein